MKNIQAVLFDLDGTLVDSLGDLAYSANLVLGRHEMPRHSEDSYRAFIGDGARKLIERIVPESCGGDQIEDLLSEYLEVYSSHVGRSTKAFPGIPSLLEDLASRDCRLGVVTNKPHDLTLSCLDAVFSEGGFGSVQGARSELPLKPSPEALEACAKELGVPAEACLFVGDSDVDMLAAQNAGMVPVGVSWGLRSVQELEAAGAAFLIENPKKLLSLPELSFGATGG